MQENRVKQLTVPAIYTLSEVEGVIGVTHQTLLSYVKAGRLKAVKIGGKWKVTEDNLKAFLSGNQA